MENRDELQSGIREGMMTGESNNEVNRKVYLIGGGIASLAAAAYFIRDGKISGDHITILESSDAIGGSLDASGSPVDGYVSRGGRMLNFSYNCTYDLLSFIPSLTDRNKTVLAEIQEFNIANETLAHARMVVRGAIVDPFPMGFSKRDKTDLGELMETTENYLADKKISDWFEPAFFDTNFWNLWATTFAFQSWHGAVEFKRYLHRFSHDFYHITSLDGVDRTPYNQFDSIVRPLIQWLRNHGVRFEMATDVTDIDFTTAAEKKTASRIHYLRNGQASHIEVDNNDFVLVTIGSMTADTGIGSMSQAPELITGDIDKGWRLWEAISLHELEFGRPAAFNTRISESKWESFTVTCNGTDFFERMEKFTGDKSGTGGLTTFKDSNWKISIALPHQPYFIGQLAHVTIFWGYALSPDKQGNFVRRKMSDCSGRDILEEVMFHLGWEGSAEEIIKSSNCIPCMMPFITSQFLPRLKGDRPPVIPNITTNLAFLGQFVEVPEDVVFTIEYSVRTAQIAVFTLLNLDRKPSPMYEGARRFNFHADKVKMKATVDPISLKI